MAQVSRSMSPVVPMARRTLWSTSVAWALPLAIAGLIGGGVILRALFLVGDAELLVRAVPDDAFYYYQVARHIVAGHGSTFDGVYPANGYHPLWMLLILPIAAVTADPLALAKGAVLLSIWCSVASALLIYAILRRALDSRWFAALGVALYYLNPQAILSTQSGLETGISTLTFVLSLFLVFRLAEDPARSSLAPLLGLSLGLLFLARTDNAFYALAIVLLAMLFTPRALWLRRLPLIAGPAALVAAPWLCWNLWTFGTPVQSSGMAIPYLSHESYVLQGHGPGDVFRESLRQLGEFLTVQHGLYDMIGLPREIMLTIVPVALGGLVLLGRRSAWTQADARLRRLGAILVGVACAGGALVGIHVAVRWNARFWYFDQLIVLLALATPVALAAFARYRHRLHLSARARVLAPLLLGLYIFALIVAPLRYATPLIMAGAYPWQTEMLDAALWLRDHMAEDESAGSFNTGIMASFSGRRVYNLDGVISPRSYDLLRQRDLMAVLSEADARYYLDYDPVWIQMYAPFLGETARRVTMMPVAEFDRPEQTFANAPIRIYRLDWQR